MRHTVFRFNWHTAAFLVASGLALALVLIDPEPRAPGMPENAAHDNRWDFTACPACHAPADLPADHLCSGEVLHPLYSRCYLCHRQ